MTGAGRAFLLHLPSFVIGNWSIARTWPGTMYSGRIFFISSRTTLVDTLSGVTYPTKIGLLVPISLTTATAVLTPLHARRADSTSPNSNRIPRNLTWLSFRPMKVKEPSVCIRTMSPTQWNKGHHMYAQGISLYTIYSMNDRCNQCARRIVSHTGFTCAVNGSISKEIIKESIPSLVPVAKVPFGNTTPGNVQDARYPNRTNLCGEVDIEYIEHNFHNNQNAKPHSMVHYAHTHILVSVKDKSLCVCHWLSDA